MPAPVTTGYLRTKVSDMSIGDYIVCNYQAASGAVGSFSNLGGPLGAEIPVAGSATPNGSFYLVKAGKGLLIADRVVQHTISWDSLNAGKAMQRSLLNPLKMSNPDVLPTSDGWSAAFSPDGIHLVIGHTAAPFVTIYRRNNDVLTKLPNPNALPAGQGNGVAFSADGIYMAVAHNAVPAVTIFKRNGNTFTKLADPDVLPTSIGYAVAFTADGNYLAVGHSVAPYLTIYKRNGDTFMKLANLTNPPGVVSGVSFSPDGTYLAIASNGAPFVSVYKRDGDTFTKLANLTAQPVNLASGVAFSPDGNYLTAVHNGSPFIVVYKRAGDTFTKLANPASLPAGNCNAVAYSADGNYMLLAHATTPFTTMYLRTGDTLTKLSNPDILPVTGNAIAIAPDGNHFVVPHNTSPYVAYYRTNMFCRSLTGGAAYADANGNPVTTNQNNGAWPPNNEWDKYIRLSNLNGRIVPDDNNVWHHDYDVLVGGKTWVQDTPTLAIAVSSIRPRRQKSGTGASWQATTASNVSAADTGFRPVFEYREV